MTHAVAPLTALLPPTPAESGEDQAPRYRLLKSFAVVRFEASGKGLIVFLPEGAELRVVGSSRLRQCCEVLYENQLYNIFEADLSGPWSMPVRSSRRGMVRVKAAARA
jgi:hypothetical protein